LLPYQQGQLDALCGLYSAVNAAILLFSRCAPLDQAEITALFQDGVARIEAGGQLASTFPLGVDLRVWRRLVSQIAQAAARSRGYAVQISRPFRGTAPVALTAVYDALASVLDDGGVVALMLCGAHHHYTVIGGHGVTRYRLFDSSGLRWLAKAACGLPDSTARHRLATGTILLLELKP
jgi:hypothetical protein